MSILSAVLFSSVSCHSGKKGEKESDTPTSGSITIAVDETLKPFVQAEVNTFQRLYVEAHITVEYKPEADAMADFMNDKVRFVIVPRDLTEDEKNKIKSAAMEPLSNLVAYDAVTLITGKQNKDTTLTVDQFLRIIDDQPFAKTKNSVYSDSTAVVFNNSHSSLISFFQREYDIKSLTKNCYQLKTTGDVVNYVKETPNSIGVIGESWISDHDDTTSARLLKEMHLLALAKSDTSKFYEPYQSDIYLKQYPFMRRVYIHLSEPRNGLATGLSAFITGDSGQRIILKSGMVPATMPVRSVEVKKEQP